MLFRSLGPENTQEANTEYWRGLANVWRISPDQAKRRLCANCEYFDDAPETLEAMEVVPQDEFDKDGGGRGYCHKFLFICHSLRVCRRWEKAPVMKEDENEDEYCLNIKDLLKHIYNNEEFDYFPNISMEFFDRIQKIYKKDIIYEKEIEVEWRPDNFCDEYFEDGIKKYKINVNFFCENCYEILLERGEIGISQFSIFYNKKEEI